MASAGVGLYRNFGRLALDPKSTGSSGTSSDRNDQEHKLQSIGNEVENRLQIDIDTLERILKNPKIGDKPVAIVSIAGQYRTGKSFLLNFFIRYLRQKGWRNPHWIGKKSTIVSDGFDWSKGTAAHTKGILMWPEVFLVEYKGEEIAVLLMDTQGLFDTDTSSDTNARILSVSTLMSSHQILNIMNRIEERDLEHLQLCSNHAKAATRSTRNKDQMIEPFQTLTFLVRDWQYEFEHEYGDYGGMEYLEGILHKDSNSPEVNDIKKAVREVFENVECFLMPHPGDNVLKKDNLTVTNRDLDEDFEPMVRKLATTILHPKNLVIKKFEGKTLNAEAILALMSSVANCFEKGRLPVIKSLFEEAAYAMNTKLMNQNFEVYKKEMQSVAKKIEAGEAVDELYMTGYHLIQLLEISLTRATGLGSPEILSEFHKKTENLCKEYFFELRQKNKQCKEEINEKILSVLTKNFSEYWKSMLQDVKQFVIKEKMPTDNDFKSLHERHQSNYMKSIERDVQGIAAHVRLDNIKLKKEFDSIFQNFRTELKPVLDLFKKELLLAELRRKEEEEKMKRKKAQFLRELIVYLGELEVSLETDCQNFTKTKKRFDEIKDLIPSWQLADVRRKFTADIKEIVEGLKKILESIDEFNEKLGHAAECDRFSSRFTSKIRLFEAMALSL